MPAPQMEASQFAKIIEQCFPQIKVSDVQIMTGGYDSVALLVNEAYIFRFPRRDDVLVHLEREIRLLPELGPALPIAVPQFEFVWDEAEPYGRTFVGYRALPGEAMELDALSVAQQAAVAQQLADFLTALHGFPIARAKGLIGAAYNVGGWRWNFQNLYADVREQVFPRLSADQREQTVWLWQSTLGNDTLWQFTPTLIHADLAPEHILYAAAQGKITGIIDWGDCEVGDPALDFTGLLYDYTPAFTQAVLARYGGTVDAHFQTRAQFYAEILPYREALYGIYTHEDAILRDAIAEIGEVLIKKAQG